MSESLVTSNVSFISGLMNEQSFVILINFISLSHQQEYQYFSNVVL